MSSISGVVSGLLLICLRGHLRLLVVTRVGGRVLRPIPLRRVTGTTLWVRRVPRLTLGWIPLRRWVALLCVRRVGRFLGHEGHPGGLGRVALLLLHGVPTPWLLLGRLLDVGSSLALARLTF